MGATGLYFDPTSPFYFTTPVIVWICSFGQGSRQNLHNAWEHVQPGHDRGREEGGAENLDPTVLRLHCWICWRHILLDRLCLPILAPKMGVWEFCFDHFRYPKFQFDRVFTGCAMTWGDEYRLVREWLMPWWLILCQLFAGIAFIVSFTSQIIDVCLLLRIPMEHILRFEFNLVLITFVMKCITSVLLLVILLLFGSCCWDRGWLLYPNYHYVSWSYAMAGFAMLIHGGAAYLMSLEMQFAKDRKERNQALLMQMYPTAGFDFGGHAGSLSTYHGSQFI